MGPTILIADDEAGLRLMLGRVLEKAGFVVIPVANGKEAVEAVGRCPVDLVITDLVMPEREGIETIVLLRREYPGLRIVAMSGAWGGQYLETAKLLGADAALEKPIEAANLVNLVRTLLANRPLAAGVH